MRYIAPFIISLVLLTACSGERKTDKTQKEIKKTYKKKDKTAIDHNSKVVYRVPTPIEFFMFFRNAGGTFKKNHLINTTEVSKYLSQKEKAIAFGIFASNLAYSSVFGQNQQTISYFETNKTLADELGFSRGYGKDLMNRFKKNLDNIDSLYNLTTDSYWEVFKFLEDQDKTELLSYITVSGWIESLYIAYNAIEKFEQNEITSSLADQQYVLDNLKAYLTEVHPNTYKNDNVFRLLININDAYIKTYNNPDNIVITKEQFTEIKKIVNQSRKILININR